MKRVWKQAFPDTLPVLTGYLVLGFGFGIIMQANGFGMLPAVLMSLLIYAGSMQYAAIGLFTGGASLLMVALTTLMVNARHIFYGISMLGTYRSMGKRRSYLIFSLTDETYSLVCRPLPQIAEERRRDYYLLVSVLNHSYWVLGTALGALVGVLLPFNSEGIEFALTALFLTVFLEQWLSSKKHFSALVGVGASLLCLVFLGADRFLIPAMLLIALVLCLYREGEK